MTEFVPISAGQWALTWQDHCFNGDLADSLERLKYRGGGWDLLDDGDIMTINCVTKVMPKTYSSFGARYHRAPVVAAFATATEAVALRDHLLAIGRVAEDAIEAEAQRLVAPFAEKTMADTLAKIHAALPHIFGRAS